MSYSQIEMQRLAASNAAIKRYADSLLVTPPNELNFVREVFRTEYRELSWRKFLRVDSSIPAWAKTHSVTKIEGFAQKPVAMNELAPNQLPQPSLSRTQTTFNLYEFINGYSWQDGELVYANHLGIALDAERALAVGRANEEFFEDVAASGDGVYFTTGFLNQATGAGDATLVTELPKAAGVGDAGWFDLSSGLPTATALEMALDLVHICDAIETATLNRNRATNVVLADALWTVGNRTTTGTDNTRTAFDIFRGMRPNVQLDRWHKANSAGASSRHRICAYDATDPQAPKMITPQEPTQLAPHRVLMGWQVPVVMKTGGVVCHKRQTMAYMDPVNQA